MPSCIKETFGSILDDPMARDRLLALAGIVVGYDGWPSGRKTT
jgi:hypothetical protein